ncbi:hypothetical protein [Flavilitoribacter nigricans]|uniref:Lipoprotein n=1 Tax=Flavilitoribacter nigricans (strain ATCC 23147 / DSM 23189 / NBRC 102662 / NCIMB 1420 / SS-2) TaxID=1122177 RepID=A0A2D0NH15_FLAN2|nr:hypothetical protein [Flavilitoribacter nigricans]PHN07676.1 hypothetical protein CRP01_06135 [Flavilitoribacter nigricans DSM 23189 = NBRC 102662]
MKRFLLLLVTASLFFLTGCLEVLEDVYLNADGSGKYQITMDMSELFSDPMLKSIIDEQAKKEAGADEDAPLEMDSVMYFKDAPEFKQLSASDQALIKDVSINMNASESKGEMVIRMNFPFSSLDDFEKMGEVMKKLNVEKDAGGPAGMMGNGMFGTQGAQFALNKRVLTRMPMPDAKELLGQDEDNLAMMKMFFQGASYTTVYHLPGKVKKTDIPNAVVDGKTVTVENNFLDIIEGKAKVAGDIKFKKR